MQKNVHFYVTVFLVICLLAGTTGCSTLWPAPTSVPVPVDVNGTAAAATATEMAVPSTEAPTAIPPTQTPVVVVEIQTATPLPTLDPGLIYTGSDVNTCLETNTRRIDILGEMLQAGSVIYQNAALGADACAAALEGRWFEGWPPTSDHHISLFMGAAENASVYQGSQWLIPPGTSAKEIAYGLAIGKCDNWRDSNVAPEPVVFDYVDLTTKSIIHTPPTTCDELRKGNPLPEEIGLIPGIQLPHFSVGYTWGQVPVGSVVTPIPAGSFSGTSKFDSENRGLTCGTAGPALGNNQDGLSEISSSWDKQCIYIVDAAKSIGGIQGKPAIGLVRGVDIQSAAATFDASIWVIPSDWVALSNAKQFATDNCPNNLPILVYEGGNWSTLEVFTCP